MPKDQIGDTEESESNASMDSNQPRAKSSVKPLAAQLKLDLRKLKSNGKRGGERRVEAKFSDPKRIWA